MPNLDVASGNALDGQRVAVMLDRWAGKRSGSAIRRRLDAINPATVTCILLAVSAVILILGTRTGSTCPFPRCSRSSQEES